MKVAGLLSGLLACLLTGCISAECTACSRGTYGPQCTQQCGHCSDTICDQVTGRCMEGCESGYHGDKCNQAVSPASGQCGIRPYDLKHSRDQRDAKGPRDPRDQRDAKRPRDPREPRVVGGHDAAYGEYPWQVRVMKDDGHHCGAAIINEYWLLSAAHCFTTTNPQTYTIVVGDRDRRKLDLDEETFDVDKIINHADYTYGPPYLNDIALIKIRPINGTGIQYSDNVQPACLPTSSTPHTVGSDCLISGWGMLVLWGPFPTILKGAVVKLWSQDDCKKAWYMDEHGQFDDGMMCAGLKEGGVDTCGGDSGGPLVVKVNGSYTLLGLTSHGDKCAKAGSPGYYARVAHFLPWIEDQMAENSNCGEKVLPKP